MCESVVVDLCCDTTFAVQAAPGISPALLERIVQARTDLSKADSREVMIECREVFHAKHSNDAAELLPAKGKSASTPFKVALAAIKKKVVDPELQKVAAKSGGVVSNHLTKPAGTAANKSSDPQEPVMISFSGLPKLEIVS